jgi:hypothetical protein
LATTNCISAPLAPTARLLPPEATALARAHARRGRPCQPLHRRGAALGLVQPLARTPTDQRAALRRWAASEPVFLPGLLAARLPQSAPHIEASLRMFDRLRRGGSLLAELARRLHTAIEFEYCGTAEAADDPRDLETAFFDAVDGPLAGSKDLWCRVSRIAHDPHDRSLRIRHSSGDGSPEGWQLASERTSQAVDALCRAAFPECEAIDGARELARWLELLLQRPYRLSERILYNNAPGGGAVFHHDAEPGQWGVCFTQLQGSTAWFAIGKRRLSRLLVRFGAQRNERAAMAALDDGDAEVAAICNRDAGFARLLAAHGALYVLTAGDVILLPSHGRDDCCWHSVAALGKSPSLAHSYGIFAGSLPRSGRVLAHEGNSR